MTHAALVDPEPPIQYDEFKTAYDVTPPELGTRLEIRHEGGGDPDYLKLTFLNVNDMVLVSVNQSEPTTTVEYFVSDPNKFPIYFYYYTGVPADPNFDFQFSVTVPGTYYIHTGNGFGPTYINMTINRVPINPPPTDKDGNNAPSDMQLLSTGVTQRENAGLPWDPHDFFYINIQPTLLVNKYMSLDLETAQDTTIQWELYDNAGILRPSLVYTSDTISIGSGPIKERRITVPGDYIIRIWMKEGYGQFNLTITILSYPNDQDNSVDEATSIGDNSVSTGEVNLTFDRDDYYEIHLDAGQPLWIILTPGNGPVDLYIFDKFENQKKASRRAGLSVDRIDGWEPDETDFYYIVVEAVYESPLWENPPTSNYTLEVWINYKPNVKANLDVKFKNPHMNEDTTSSSYDVTAIFEDKDGDPLVYELDMSYNNTLMDIQITDEHKLVFTPVADASNFKVQFLLNATDPHGLMVNYTATIWVDPVNDGPYVDYSEVPDVILMGEDLVKSGVNVTKAFRDIDDGFSTWKFTTTTTSHINVELDTATWLATFTPLVENWFGDETFTVTCTDKGGLTAEITFKITMNEINDVPIVLAYIDPITIDEEATYTFDLETGPKGAYFKDIEGKQMSYAFADNGSLTMTIEGTLVTITGQLDFVGTVSKLKIWAIDDLGAKSENITLFIQVLDKPDPPVLTRLIESANIQEGKSVTFAQDVYYSLFDRDSAFSDLLWNWYVNGVLVPPINISDKYNFEYIAPVTAEKDRTVTVKLEVIDGEFVKDVSWTVMVTNLNAAPDKPVVTTPEDKTEFKQGETITFTASSSDLDGDTLTYKWFLDELEEVGTGPTLELKDVEPGPHKVTVEVKDPSGAESTQDFEFKVLKKEGGGDDSPGFGSAYLVLALIGAIAIIAVTRRR